MIKNSTLISLQYRAENFEVFDWCEFKKLRASSFKENAVAVCDIVLNSTELTELDPSWVNFDENLTVGAKVKLIDVFKPKVTCNLGTLLSLDDLFLASSCNQNFFGVVPTEAFKEIEICSVNTSYNRFTDYHFLEGSPDLKKIEMLTHKVPESTARISQVSLMVDVATQWVLLHEFSHWLMGHNHIVKNNSINEVTHKILDFESNCNDKFLSMDEMKCIELQADGLAFELLVHTVFCNIIPNHSWENYLDVSAKYEENIDLAVIENRLRLLLVACGSVVLLFEKIRSQEPDSQSSAYPRPLTRLQNLFATSIRLVGTYSHVLAINDAGKLVISPDKYKENESQFKQLLSGMIKGIDDLSVITSVLEINGSVEKEQVESYRNSCKEIMNGEIFIPDIQSLMSGPVVTNKMKGENKKSMEEYIRLLSVQDGLNQKLEEFSLIEL